MPYFNRSTISRSGRPLGEPAAAFAAILLARLTGHSRKRASELLSADPNCASGTIWSIAACAANDGIKTAEQFEVWLDGENSSL